MCRIGRERALPEFDRHMNPGTLPQIEWLSPTLPGRPPHSNGSELHLLSFGTSLPTDTDVRCMPELPARLLSLPKPPPVPLEIPIARGPCP